MSFEITDSAVIAALGDAYNARDWQESYRIIFEALSHVTQETVIDPGSAPPMVRTRYTPRADVHEGVWLLIKGPENVNSNTGQFSQSGSVSPEVGLLSMAPA